MNLHRSGEQGNLPERSKRYFQKENYWYYTTREGVNIGPYDSFSGAERGVSEFIEFIRNAEHSMIETLEQYGRAVA